MFETELSVNYLWHFVQQQTGFEMFVSCGFCTWLRSQWLTDNWQQDFVVVGFSLK